MLGLKNTRGRGLTAANGSETFTGRHKKLMGWLQLTSLGLALSACSTSGPAIDVDQYWVEQNPSQSESNFQGLIADRPELKSAPFELEYIEVLTQMAKAQLEQGKIEISKSTLDRAQAGLGQVKKDPESQEYQLVKARLILVRGQWVKTQALLRYQARSYFHQAYSIASTQRLDFFAIEAAYYLAMEEPSIEGQIHWNQAALRLAQVTRDAAAQAWIGRIRHQMGWSYLDHHFYQKAHDEFQKEIIWRSANVTSSSSQQEALLAARWARGKTLRLLGQTEEALAIQLNLRGEYDAIGKTNGYVYEELGEIALNQSQKEEMQKYFMLAYWELSRDRQMAQAQPQRMARIKMLGNVLE